MKYILISLLVHLAILFAIFETNPVLSNKVEKVTSIQLVKIASPNVVQTETKKATPTPSEPKKEKEIKIEPKKIEPIKKSEPEPTSNSGEVIKEPTKNSEPIVSGESGEKGETSVERDENISTLSSGDLVGVNQNIPGLKYQIISSPDPIYPAQAKKFRLKEKIVVKTKFLIGYGGKVESVEILQGPNKFGFEEKTKEALRDWKFEPIQYKGKKIKLYFYKDFIFELK